MNSSTRLINSIVGRFVSLPPDARMEVATKLLRWLDEDRAARDKNEARVSSSLRSNLLDKFRAEVEAASYS